MTIPRMKPSYAILSVVLVDGRQEGIIALPPSCRCGSRRRPVCSSFPRSPGPARRPCKPVRGPARDCGPEDPGAVSKYQARLFRRTCWPCWSRGSYAMACRRAEDDSRNRPVAQYRCSRARHGTRQVLLVARNAGIVAGEPFEPSNRLLEQRLRGLGFAAITRKSSPSMA